MDFDSINLENARGNLDSMALFVNRGDMDFFVPKS